LLSRVRVEVFEQRAMRAKPIPERFYAITRYLNIDRARQVIEFKAFDGKKVFSKEPDA